MFLPIQTLEYYATIPSTNGRVLELLRQPNKPKLPCLVIAEQQTAGRGRGDKWWWSSEGALLMSIGIELAPEFIERAQLPMLSVSVAKAVINVLKEYLPQQKLELHLPNDVYVNEKKICGILLESPTPKYCVIGIGLNVNNRLADVPLEMRDELACRLITSMIELRKCTTHIPQLIDKLLSELSK